VREAVFLFLPRRLSELYAEKFDINFLRQ
jgi:hypothetical protein